MKKSRKALSLVLSFLIAFASMPMVYTATVASDVSPYAAEEKGTIDNPTLPVSESGEYSQIETNQLSFTQKSLNFTYYQTKNDEYFRIYQATQMEKYCGSMTASVTVDFHTYTFDVEDSTTKAFVDNNLADYSWVAGTDESGETAFPDGFELEGTYWLGCADYSWSLGLVFKGMDSAQKGTYSTGYVQKLHYTTNVNGTVNEYSTPIPTTITILDARTLVDEIAKAESVIENADEYTPEYVSAVKSILNSIPDDLRDFSKVYDQSVIDGFVEEFNDIIKNAADYTEYNTVYSQLMAITNNKGAFTNDSYNAFKNEIVAIDAELSKNLDKTQQAIVDAATQDLRNAYNKLVFTDISETNTSGGYTTNGDDGDMSFVVDNTDFKFVQTKDDQIFEYSQLWTITRSGGNNSRDFGGMILDESLNCMGTDCLAGGSISPNGTTAFIDRLTDDSYEKITADNEEEESITANEFTCWEEYTDASCTQVDTSTEIVDKTGAYIGALDSDRNYSYSQNEDYYLQNSPVFRANPAGTYGEITLNYVLRTGWHYETGGIGGWLGTDHYKHIHVNTTIHVTDARQLISAVAEAKNTLANPGEHTDEYITALHAAVDSVPVELLRGVEYYTQAQVDKLYSDITSIPENVADYSEFVKVFDEMLNTNKDKYTQESYDTFIHELYAINQALPKNLTADEQGVIDSAIEAIYQAYDKLVTSHLNSDSVFTQDDIEEDLGYNPLEFSLATTQYNFMMTSDGQKFALGTDLTLRKTRTDYNCYFRGIGFYAEPTAEEINSSYVAPDCSTDQGCHGLDAIANNQTRTIVDSCTGLEKYTSRDDGGNIARHNTWVNTSGGALASNGVLVNDLALSSTESSAHADMYYTGPVGGETKEITADYVLWLGWWYVQPFFGENLSTKSYRHVHIPVSVKITDARALASLYEDVADLIENHSDYSYTMSTIANLYYAWTKVPVDMVEGEVYYTQEEVNANYDALYKAYTELNEGANYNDYFDASIKAQEIIVSGGADKYGNPLYDPDVYKQFVEDVTEIDTNLDKNLPADAEGKNQAIIDEATAGILGAIEILEATKRADYTDLFDAMAEAEKILNSPANTYTNETLSKIQSAYDNAQALDKALPSSEQAQVDSIASELKEAVDGAEFKADYSEFEEAYKRVEDIVNNPDQYAGETVEAAKNALEEADKLDKDLADLNSSRQTIADATDALNAVADNTKKPADYTTYNQYMDIINALNPVQYPGGAYTEFMETVEGIDANLPKDLSEDEQAQVDAACNALLDAYNKLLSGASTNPDATGDVFTQDDISDEYSGSFKFSVASKDYYFTQTVNDEKLMVETDLVVSNGDSANTAITLDSLKMNILTASEALNKCTGECLNQDAVPEAFADNIFCLPNIQYNVITGVEPVLDANGNQIADSNGDMAWFTTWENVSGTALSSGGVLNSSTAITEESSASAYYVFASAGGGDTTTKERTHTYVLRLGWTENGVAYHTHIPVTLHISDARALYQTYYAYKDFIDAGNDGSYTDASFQAAADILAAVNTDIVHGNGYYTQDEINAELAKLADAASALKSKADLSELETLVEQANGMLNNDEVTYTQSTIDALNKAIEDAAALGSDLEANEENNNAIQNAVDELKAAIDGAQEKADYSDYNDAKADADSLVNDDGNGNPIYDEDAFNAYKEAVEGVDNALNKDLPNDNDGVNQGIIDDATQSLEDLRAELEDNKKADYSAFEAAKDALEEIVNAPDGTYTDETVQKAQDALDEANKIPSDMVVGENNANQDMIDDATQNMQDVIDSAEKKADYSDFDAAKDALEDIVNNPDKYTDETVKNAQDALEEANKIDQDLPMDEDGVNQGIIDDATQNMQDVINGAQEKADYSDYNDAKAEADSLVNDDGNGNPIYDEDAFSDYKEAVENVDKGLDKNLPKDDEGKNQTIIDDATQSLEDLKAELEEKKIYTVTFIGLDGEAITAIEYVNGSAFGTISAPALPEATDTIVYAGWLNGDAFMSTDSVLTGDVTLTIATELCKILAKDGTTVLVNDNGFITGVDKNTTVAEFKASLQNNAEAVAITDIAGNALADDALIGTGAVVTLKSIYVEAVYETKAVIIYGDLDSDGDVDDTDLAMSKKAAVADESFYSDAQKAIFLANDVNGDGYIDVLDSWVIGRITKGKMTVLIAQ